MSAFNKAPGHHIDGLQVLATGEQVAADSLVIPLAAIPETDNTGAEADPADGDIRKVVFALTDLIYRIMTSAKWAGADDPPQKIRVQRQQPIYDGAGVSTVTVTADITVGELPAGSREVAAE